MRRPRLDLGLGWITAIGALAAVVALFAAHGCGRGEGGGPPAIRIAIESDPTSLDPALSIDVASGRLIALIAPGLVRFDRDLHLTPALAESWETLEEGRVYRFTMRSGARFSSGGAITAADAKRSFERVLDPKTRSPRDWIFQRIEGAQAFQEGKAASVSGIGAPDDTHLVIRLAAPFAPFLSMLAMPQAAVLPAHSAAGPAGAAGAGEDLEGAGPWRLATWSRDDRLLLEANRVSWRPPRAERLEVRILPQPAMQMTDFEASRLDIVQVPQADLARVRATPPAGSRLVSSPDLAVYYVGLSNLHPPFRDARVRRAMNLAVNLDALVRAFEGAGVRAHGSIPPGLGGYDPDRAPYPYLPDSARALLAAAGYPEGFSFTILEREGSRFGRALLAIQSDLAAVGVRATIEPREWGALKETIDNGRAEAFLADWYADYPDAENFLYPLFHSSNVGGGGNRAAYRNAAIDSLIEAAQREPAVASREALYREIDARVHAEAPWIYLWHPVNFLLVRDDLEGFEPHPLFFGEDYAEIARRAAP